ncbi:hypothetical protein [Bdellovibrio reynosensis]|uniref:Outer membrane protein beta-barrel domain-containing protein n=1 Tax=Bdellovibrio reynosensis TaxID=2835041 RepID=A0ABY4CDC9_9BACT|nr:hypothetical protein [Bdellovibrio reynosensis]UOF02459.1 hypothetical protein MNR06_05785 [Bdellovibrio reynosensis]
MSTILSSRAFAIGYPESAAFEMSMEAAGQILSSPALPSLDNDGKSLSPLVGTVKMEGIREEGTLANGDPLIVENSGTVTGHVAGLTFNYSGKGDLGFFGMLGYSKVQGEMSSTVSTFAYTTDVRDISAQSLVGAAGLTYRLIGDDKSTFTLGVFGGPAFISSEASANIHHDTGITKVTTKPNISGMYFGLQLAFRFGKFRINPYLNALGNSDPQCIKPDYSGADYAVGEYNRCDDGTPGVTTFALIGGSGINIGYGRFQFGLVQSGGTGTQSLKTTPLMLSFRASL